MRIDKNIEVLLKLDCLHYYETMSTEDKAKLYHLENPSSLKLEHHVWADLWEIFYKNKGVGYVSLGKDSRNRVISVDGIYLIEKYRHKNIIQKIAFKLAQYYFEELGFNKVEASAFEFNYESTHLCRKYANEEGCRLQSIFYKSQYWDKNLFGLTKEDYERGIKEIF